MRLPDSQTARPPEGCVPFPGEDIFELPLLLPAEKAAALERAARAQGLTVGALTRRLIGAFLDAQRKVPGLEP